MRKKRKIITTKTGMQMKKFKNSDNAVVGIVTAFLIVGLVVAVLAVIQTQYVPKWMKEKEADHMEEVANQFTQLKYALDIQSIINGTTAISTSITLGNKELPFFDSVRTFGNLEIVENSFDITIEQWNVTTPQRSTSDSIKYLSANSYFVNQQYIYEAGALILSQDGSNILFGKPSLSVRGYGNDSIISLAIINISGVGGKTFAGGYGTYPIYTEVNKEVPPYADIYNVTNITIKTKYTNAWNKTIYSAFLYHLNESHYSLTEVVNDRIEIQFKDPSKNHYHLRMRVVDISAQISGGIAE